MTDREKAIKDLEDIIATAEGIKGLSDDAGITISLDKIESLRFALESLKTDIRSFPAITEEEIVKPYLEKLKEQISKSCYKALITDDGNIKESKVLQIIDNLLTEKGAEG